MSGRKFKAGKAAHHGLTETRKVRCLDTLAEYEIFDRTIMPRLRKMVLENWTPDRIRRYFAPIMQGLMVQQGLRGSFRAIKDTLDRYEGTAVQRTESKTVYAQMSKKELAALAIQKLLDAKIIDTTGRVLRETDTDKSES